jgi:hypothetical protein
VGRRLCAWVWAGVTGQETPERTLSKAGTVLTDLLSPPSPGTKHIPLKGGKSFCPLLSAV